MRVRRRVAGDAKHRKRRALGEVRIRQVACDRGGLRQIDRAERNGRAAASKHLEIGPSRDRGHIGERVAGDA